MVGKLILSSMTFAASSLDRLVTRTYISVLLEGNTTTKMSFHGDLKSPLKSNDNSVNIPKRQTPQVVLQLV